MDRCGYQGFGSGDHPEGPGCTLEAGHLGRCAVVDGKVSRIVLEDQDLWSLLYGYGPGQHARDHRNATEEERWQIIFTKLLDATHGLKTTDTATLVLVIE